FFDGEPECEYHHRFDRWLDVHRVRLDDGRRLIVHRDITELEEREERPAQQREAAISARADAEREAEIRRAMLDNLPTGVSLFERNGDIIQMNDAVFDLNRLPRNLFAEFTNIREVFRWQMEHGQVVDGDADIETRLAGRMARFLDGQRHHEIHQR